MANSKIERRNRLNQLMDLYGELLTDRQREFMELHYAEDLSFGEIGEQFDVSRQAIHDAVKHGEESLENYELKLKLMTRFPQLIGADKKGDSIDEEKTQAFPPLAEQVVNGNLSAPLEQLAKVIAELKASGGVIYNAVEVAATLEAVELNLKKALKG